jgi:hypothetical protein
MAFVPLRFPKSLAGWSIHIVMLAVLTVVITRLRLPVTPGSIAGWLLWVAIVVPLMLFGEWVHNMAPKLDKWSSLARIALGVVLGCIFFVLFFMFAGPVLDAAIKR